jgi:hypothetical protein
VRWQNDPAARLYYVYENIRGEVSIDHGVSALICFARASLSIGRYTRGWAVVEVENWLITSSTRRRQQATSPPGRPALKICMIDPVGGSVSLHGIRCVWNWVA